jgi:glucose-1-phosphate thymidylyltransferase
LEYSQIRNLEHRIEDSLIGRHVVIHRSPIRPRAYKFTLGDHSQLGLLGNGR